ncbi:DUF1318 domain-containing protein [Sphingomonas koreensis]|nr:DUF1318 domain-containing protein [Sphingomonas koreensis]TPG39690.1 DUF1318 domain-containing protein [Sphingomonas koreensis]
MKQGKLILFAIAAFGLAGAAQAQRDPAYAQARAQGLIGERTDGYLGVVGSAPADIKATVNAINIKRRAAYTAAAQQQNATIEDFAFTSGCNLIARTQPGEKYQAPDGSWKTRGSAPAERDSRCK